MKQLQLNSDKLTSKVWDSVVVGGGMVGAATALGLAQKGLKVLILEKQPVDTVWEPKSEYRMRVSALTRASEKVLKNLGVWQGINRRRSHAFKAMHVWDEVTPGEVHFSASEMQEPNLGYIVENELVQAAIWEQIEQQKNISVLFSAKLKTLELEGELAHLTLNKGVKLKTRLLIGADGASSRVRELSNIALTTYDYEQCAVVGCVKTELSHQDTCWQRYTENGPFAFLSMGDNTSSIAWYLPIEKMEWALSLDDAAFAKEIGLASEHKLGRVVEVSKRGAFPLVRRHAENYVKSNLALIGDAAHTIHPQAGQGVNLGLLDAAALIETVVKAKELGKNWGSFSVLRKYERWRRGDNEIVQRSMEAFDWIFKQDASLKIRLRKMMLPLANRSTLLKNWLMAQALNGREALPEMARRVPKN